MDQVLRERLPVIALRHRHHRQRRRRRDHGARAGRQRRPHAGPRARRPRPAGGRELESRGGLEAPALPRARSVARRGRASEFLPYTHYGVGGNTKFWGSVLYRLRREDFQAVEHADGVSPAWPIDYDTLAPYYDRAERALSRARRSTASTRPSPSAGRFLTRRFLTRPGWTRSSTRCAARDCIPRRCRSGLIRPGEEGRLSALQHLQLVPLPHPRQERRRGLRRAAGACPCQRRAVDQRSGVAV